MSDTPATNTSRRRFVNWLWRLPVVAALLGGSYGIYEAWRVHFGKKRPDPTPEFVSKGRQRVASLDELSETWEAVSFRYADIPAIALSLPEAIPGALMVAGRHYAAFSRVCTHLGCITDFSRDLDAIAFAFNYRSDKPALVCHCHLSVFLPTKAGRAVSGPAVEPLPRVRLELIDNILYATGIEQMD